MGTKTSDQLTDVTYWLVLQLANNEQVIDLNSAYKGSTELDVLYQILTSKATLYWWKNYNIELSLVTVNNAFFRAIAILHDRNIEFDRTRKGAATEWVKELLHL